MRIDVQKKNRFAIESTLFVIITSKDDPKKELKSVDWGRYKNKNGLEYGIFTGKVIQRTYHSTGESYQIQAGAPFTHEYIWVDPDIDKVFETQDEAVRNADDLGSSSETDYSAENIQKVVENVSEAMGKALQALFKDLN